MTHRVVVQPQAQADVRRQFAWLAQRSPGGAQRWYEAWLEVLDQVALQPFRFALAEENNFFTDELWQAS